MLVSSTLLKLLQYFLEMLKKKVNLSSSQAKLARAAAGALADACEPRGGRRTPHSAATLLSASPVGATGPGRPARGGRCGVRPAAAPVECVTAEEAGSADAGGGG
jgi:hypothetical protein